MTTTTIHIRLLHNDPIPLTERKEKNDGVILNHEYHILVLSNVQFSEKVITDGTKYKNSAARPNIQQVTTKIFPLTTQKIAKHHFTPPTYYTGSKCKRHSKRLTPPLSGSAHLLPIPPEVVFIYILVILEVT